MNKEDLFFKKAISRYTRGDIKKKDLISKHMQDHHISYDEYENKKLKSISDGFVARKKIYLDLNFWINLRKSVYTKQATNKTNEFIVYREIFALLKQLVKDQKVLCPVSAPLWNEVMKMRSSINRSGIAQMMDALSLGCTLSPNIYEKELEAILLKHDPLYKQRFDYVWVKPVTLCGQIDLIENKSGMDKELLLALRKNLLDMLLETLRFEAIQHEHPGRQIYNYIKSQFQRLVSYLKDDIYWAIDRPEKFPIVFISTIRNSIQRLAEINKVKDIDVLKLIEDLDTDNLAEISPSIYAWSALFCDILIDKGYKIKENDFFDIQHGSQAVAYYDYFFTEKSLSTRIKHRKLDETFNTITEYDPNQVLSILKQL